MPIPGDLFCYVLDLGVCDDRPAVAAVAVIIDPCVADVLGLTTGNITSVNVKSIGIAPNDRASFADDLFDSSLFHFFGSPFIFFVAVSGRGGERLLKYMYIITVNGYNVNSSAKNFQGKYA